jgi:CHAT domain-containing protein
LRRAFGIAGAESQVVSLWRIADDITPMLMGVYYRALAAGAGRSEALQQAQLQLLRESAYAHPYFWAAFVPTGDWRPLLQ